MLRSIDIDWDVVRNKGTTNIELRNLLHLYNIDNVNIIADDHVNVISQSRPISIVNYESSSQSGSHWYTVILKSKTLYIYDSLGAPPDDVILDLAQERNYKIITTDEPNQAYDSSLCGLWAVWAILTYIKGMNLLTIYEVVKGMSLTQKVDLLMKTFIEERTRSSE